MARALPSQPSLDWLRHQAKDLQSAADHGDSEAQRRIRAVAETASLHAAQLAIAREYGLASWARLKAEVLRRRAIEDGDVDALHAVLRADPTLARDGIRSPLSAVADSPLQYVGVGRLHQEWTHNRAGELTRALLAAGAAPDGNPAASESPLITAASYGELGMARALVEAGADLEAQGRAAPGSATPLAHAVHYGMPGIVDLLVAAGARVHDIVEAAGAGDISGYDATAELPLALRAAAVCERPSVIDELLDRGVAINGWYRTLTERDGATALHSAAWEGKALAVAHLLKRGADPHLTDPRFAATPLEWCRHRHTELRAGWGHADVERILETVSD